MTMAPSEARQLDEVLNKPPPSATWYRADGLAIPNLPIDPYHRMLYGKKGWTLNPPKEQSGESAAPPAVEGETKAMRTATVAKPPRHIHVMQPEIGSPCLVAGCGAARQKAKGGFVVKGKKS